MDAPLLFLERYHRESDEFSDHIVIMKQFLKMTLIFTASHYVCIINNLLFGRTCEKLRCNYIVAKLAS